MSRLPEFLQPRIVTKTEEGRQDPALMVALE